MKWGNWAKSKLHRVIIDVALRKPFFLYGCNIRYGTADSPIPDPIQYMIVFEKFDCCMKF